MNTSDIVGLLAGLFAVCTGIYWACHRVYDRWSQPSTHTQTQKRITYQTLAKLANIRVNHKELSSDNTIYLTQFKKDGYIALAYHVVYGWLIYFKDPTNIYYLAISMLLVYEYFDARALTHPLTLAIFASVSMLSHVSGMSQLLRNQHTINHLLVSKFVFKKGRHCQSGDLVDVHINHTVPQKELQRGDLVEVNENAPIPADILLIDNTTKVSVQELELSGENIVLLKTGLDIDPFNPTVAKDSTLIINHHQNEGIIMVGNDCSRVIQYTSRNIVYRGTKIADGKAHGIVLETGNDCQIYRINSERSKAATHVQKIITKICIANLYLMLLLASCVSVAIYAKTFHSANMLSYRELWTIIRRMILLFNTMVPLSLQFFFNTGSGILSRRIAKSNSVIINPSGMKAFQITPHFIVTDKTGTLTTNTMTLGGIIQRAHNGAITNITQAGISLSEMIVHNIIACTETQPHSRTYELLKNDPIEACLAQIVLAATDLQMTTNVFQENGNGYYVLRKPTGDTQYKRHYYRPFSYETEVKISVVSSDPDTITLHLQGTPEAIDKYTGGQCTELLQYVDQQPSEPNTYKRMIAHCCGNITTEQLVELKLDPIKFLQYAANSGLFASSTPHTISLYVFYDHVIPNVDQSIQQLLTSGKDLTMLTGDKMSSAIEISRTIGLINAGTGTESQQLINIEPPYQQAALDRITPSTTIMINGRYLDELCSSRAQLLAFAIKSTRKRIIYRASPNGKQIFIEFLQKQFPNNEVMMVGDGSNDLAALLQANLGAAIANDDNLNVRNTAEVVLRDWNQIPPLLVDFTKKQAIINNVAQWVLMKHMITAFMLLTLLLFSRFERIRDPTSPLLMNAFNACMFACMCLYCWKTEGYIRGDDKSPNGLGFYYNGALLGVANCLGVVAFVDIRENATLVTILLIILQSTELMWHLYRKHQSNRKI